MATSLFSDIIFGPVQSRRLGLSLGVNLLPLNNKLCSFECIYCECGWSLKGVQSQFNRTEDVIATLKDKLTEMASQGRLPDVITFAGNGEPTMHPDFEQIIDQTIAIRDMLAPQARISVLSNATFIHKESVRRALLRVDNNILKLDSAFDSTARIMDKPKGDYSIERQVELMKQFNGRLIIQTMFLKGMVDGEAIDNTTNQEVQAWLELVQSIAPSKVMVYTIDRDTPLKTLEKIPVEKLKEIASRVESLGIECSVAG